MAAGSTQKGRRARRPGTTWAAPYAAAVDRGHCDSCGDDDVGAVVEVVEDVVDGSVTGTSVVEVVDDVEPVDDVELRGVVELVDEPDWTSSGLRTLPG